MPKTPAPIDMVLHCPACGLQHIDRDEALDFKPDGGCTCAGPEGPCETCESNRQTYEELWRNPPHRSHLCAGCGHVWRPADVCTNGVAAVKTKGKQDSPVVDKTTWRGLLDDLAKVLRLIANNVSTGHLVTAHTRLMQIANDIDTRERS